jgi:hypothetical protein
MRAALEQRSAGSGTIEQRRFARAVAGIPAVRFSRPLRARPSTASPIWIDWNIDPAA